ncbi:hypothetical protein PITC_015220 [Penicillium italicum]|uniref:Uncharacterized protein n=1 Tax=Penicillium italicum TaxID=40296 RepID=A0A0A2KRM6_PENIT|nr:hypothetical protein PITC_015220 [Penicillium italicum]
MVTTRATAGGTRPKVQPLPAKPSKAEKAAKAAIIKKENEEKKIERERAKREKDVDKAIAKAEKDAIKAAAKAAKAAKVANTKNSTKGTKHATAAKAKASKASKASKITKTTKVTKTTKSTKVTNNRASAAITKASTNQHDEDEHEDEESEGEHYEPQAKRRKLETAAPQNLYVEMGPPKERPALRIGEWEYTRKADVPEGVENKDDRPLPHIYIGGTAPQPRWVITQSESIKVPSNQYASRRTGSASEFGDLQWTFEEGEFQNWTGLEYPALYELAYLCLEYTLIDTEIREQIYESLAEGPLPTSVTVGDKWYPALPPMPITRHFATGSSQQTSRKSSDTAFYFRDYERPNMAARARDDHMPQHCPHALDSNISNQPRLEGWPTASRSASPDPESERGSEKGSEESQSDKSTESSVSDEVYLKRNSESTLELTAAISLGNEQHSKKESKHGSEHDSEESQSVDSRRSSVTRESDLELNPEGAYSEPTTPTPLGNDEKIAHEEGSIFGDADDDQVEPNSARDSREQSPNSLFSGSGSDSEVSASSKTSEPGKFNAADDNSAQSTNSLSPESHDGLFSPEEIEKYFRKKQGNFESLGGVEHHEVPERKRQAQPPPSPFQEGLEALEDAHKESEIDELEAREIRESSKRMRMESPSTPSPPTTRRKTAAENMVEKVVSFARGGREKREEMRAAAAEKISDKPPVALLKKTTGNRPGARSQADAPSPEIPPNLQDRFLEQTKAYLKDPIQRARHFPDPLAVRRARVWAGEELVDHEIKPTFDATLPPWAERHRPFRQWQDPVSVSCIEIFKNHADHTRLDWNSTRAYSTHQSFEIEKTEQGAR